MKKIVLLTGATGFVGRQILKVLAAENVSVRLVVRDKPDVHYDPSLRVDKIIKTTDLFSEQSHWWADACKGVDAVIHCAWYVEPGKYLTSEKNLDCLIGTLLLARGAVEAGVRKFIGVGTCFEYDLSVGMLSTQTALMPTSPYAAAKAAAYLQLKQYFSSQQLEFVWCRLFYLYGEGEDSRRLVPYIHGQLKAGHYAKLTSGKQIRDFLDVEKAAAMIAKTAQSDIQGAVNICSGVPITVRQMAEKIADEYGKRELLLFGARPDNPVDPPCVVGIGTNLD